MASFSVRPSVLSNLKDLLLIKSLVRLVLKCNRSQSFASVTIGDDPRNVKGIQKISIGTDFRIFINIKFSVTIMNLISIREFF